MGEARKKVGWLAESFFGLAALSVLAAGANVSAQPGEKEYLASPSSRISYTLKHPLHVIRGESKQVTCMVRMTQDTTAGTIDCSAPMLSFDSGNENRDSHMLEVVEALRFPAVSFTGHPVRKDKDLWRVEGELAFHGLTRPIAFQVKTTYTPGQVRVQGEFPLSLTDFKVKRPSLMFFSTEDTVRIGLDIQGKFP